MNKKASFLHENLIFIVLNVIFFTILLVFVTMKGSAVHIAEEETAKQLALLIDASKPVTNLEINFKDFFEEAESNGIRRERSIIIDNFENVIVARGSEDTFYDYSYFNDVNINFNFEGDYLILEIVE
jgi:hypothetical protein